MRAFVASRPELKKYYSSSGSRKMVPDGKLDQHKRLERLGNGKYVDKNKRPFYPPSFKIFAKKKKRFKAKECIVGLITHAAIKHLTTIVQSTEGKWKYGRLGGSDM